MSKRKYHKKFVGNHELAPETLMMGYGYSPELSEWSLKPPVFMTSTFAFSSAQAGKDFFELTLGRREKREGEELGLIYSRFNNPSIEILEDRLSAWENADSALVFGSGMAAISSALFAHSAPGDVIVYCAPIYGGTEAICRDIFPKYGIKSVEYVAGTDEDTLTPAIEEAKKLGRVAVILGETPANPTNQLIDLKQLVAMADKLEKEQGHRPITMVDNTFLGPVWQQPVKHGIDISLYSLTKYVGGHSDLIAGAAIGNAAAMMPVRKFRSAMGPVLDAHTSWLLMRSMETLQVRFERAAQNARRIAEYLRDHPKVTKVHFLEFLPEGSEQRRIFDQQCGSAGSTFSFDVIGGEEGAFRVLDNLKVIKLAVSLGGTESLMETPYSMTHAVVPDNIKEKIGILPETLRIAVGIENIDDLIADLEQALAAL